MGLCAFVVLFFRYLLGVRADEEFPEKIIDVDRRGRTVQVSTGVPYNLAFVTPTMIFSGTVSVEAHHPFIA